jgi:hypothetical protein
MLRRVAVSLVLVAAACGESREEKDFERIERVCEGLTTSGATLDSSAIELRFSTFVPFGPDCGAVAPMASNDTCGEGTAENPVCRAFWVWYPRDPGLCEPTGCCLICEARVTQADLDENSGEAKVCAARFLRGQLCP